jgi:hypothetical protein
MKKIRAFLFRLMLRLSRHELLRWMPDAAYLKIQYYLKLGERLNLAAPKLYNEKLQWLKLFDRDERYCALVDKLDARDFVARTIGEAYLIPALGRVDSVEQIDWAALPNRFVLKCTHGSGCNIICRDKSSLDIAWAKAKVRGYMRRNWFGLSREWPYKNLKPRILIEAFLESDTGDVPPDYKIMCFGGEPHYIVVDVDRYKGHKRNYYDTDWKKVPVENRHPNYDGDIPRPQKLSEMLAIAKKLSRDLPHVRVDLYAIGDKIYFGELTFFHGYGMEVFIPRAFERHMGDLLALPGPRDIQQH